MQDQETMFGDVIDTEDSSWHRHLPRVRQICSSSWETSSNIRETVTNSISLVGTTRATHNKIISNKTISNRTISKTITIKVGVDGMVSISSNNSSRCTIVISTKPIRLINIKEEEEVMRQTTVI